tara:strand:- start:479 stop:1435 length:957 start_codon:yes stop_codon:yes gene_type:complete
MPEEEKKTVDIDTSGPEVEVELPEIKEEKNETVENNIESTNSIEKPSEQSTVQTSEEKKEPQQTKELEEYSEGVKRRIAKLTKKMREAERREEAATLYARGVLDEQEKLKSRLAKLDTGYVSEMEGRVKSSMEAAVAKLAKAREDNNLKDEVSAQAEISRLGYEEARLNDLKSKQVKEEKPVEQQEELNQPIPRRIDPKAQEWAEKNTWFNKDLVMTEGAKAIHRQLVEEEGYDPVNQSEEYYSEIDKRIALEFPHKFVKKEEETTKPTQTVASATRSSRSGRKTQRLTPSEVAIAKKLGVPLDKYAEQKAKLTTKEA